MRVKEIIDYCRFKVNRSRYYFRKTKIPFQNKLISEINKSIKLNKKNINPLRKNKNPEFPEKKELQRYWSVYLNIMRMLSKYNRFDDYFKWRNYQDAFLKGNRVYCKDLFEMWYVQNYQPKKILEIGSRTGRSLLYKMLFNYNSNPLYFCIEPFVEIGNPRVIKRNLMGLYNNQIHLFVGFSKKIIPEIKSNWNLKFDYILIDGSHKEKDAYNDLCMSADLLEKNGIICFDDLGLLESVWNKWKQKHKDRFVTKEYKERFAFAVARKNL